MEISQKLLCFLFLASLVLGFLLGFLYDLFRLIEMLLGFSKDIRDFQKSQKFSRRYSLCHRILLFAEDLAWMMIATLSLILLLYFVNDGQFRIIALLGMAGGLFVYRVIFGRLFLKISGTLAAWIRKLILMLLLPFRLLGKWICNITLVPLCRMYLDILDRKRRVLTERNIKNFQERASSLFQNQK
ncbi:MAG: hypothetical protein E7645_00955 [Ruminococcaceae bacterium]|nr:hypothetical protein [Oscillospiraceae bacterium]